VERTEGMFAESRTFALDRRDTDCMLHRVYQAAATCSCVPRQGRSASAERRLLSEREKQPERNSGGKGGGKGKRPLRRTHTDSHTPRIQLSPLSFSRVSLPVLPCLVPFLPCVCFVRACPLLGDRRTAPSELAQAQGKGRDKPRGGRWG
jgi:hypothetical protein